MRTHEILIKLTDRGPEKEGDGRFVVRTDFDKEMNVKILCNTLEKISSALKQKVRESKNKNKNSLTVGDLSE